MSNWIFGQLKIRGKFENLKDFAKNGLQPVDFFENDILYPAYEEDDERFYFNCRNITLAVKNTVRTFVETDSIIFNVFEADNFDNIIIVLPIKAEWRINVDDLLKISEQYDVDMKIQSFQDASEMSQLIEIIDKQITQNDYIKYDNWKWDCPCPELWHCVSPRPKIFLVD